MINIYIYIYIQINRYHVKVSEHLYYNLAKQDVS
jgi:hypothetical protein